MVKWDDPDILEFKKEAKTAQEEFQSLLGDREWDVIEKNEETFLFLKIGFGLFGPPSSEPTIENLNTGYTQEQLKEIRIISTKLLGRIDFKTENLHFACIFILVKIHDKRCTLPVFKSKPEKADSGIYVDLNGRTYPDWSDFLKKNKLPKCIYCYPKQGFYELVDNEVAISFATSPACNLGNRVLRIVDIGSTVVTLGSVGVGLAALCTLPVAGPILAASAIAGISTGAYGITRSSHELVDRAKHGQSIKLNNSDARSCWISIVGSAFGFAQFGMLAAVSRTARAGEVMGKFGRIAFMAVQTGSLTVNGVGIIHGLTILIDKKERNELNALDIFQFTASILFFTNSAVNLKTATTITKEIQSDIIKSHRDNLTGGAKKLFKWHTGKLRGKDELHGNARVVKSLNRIENTQDLYNLMVDKNVAHYKVKLTENGYEGALNINKSFKIHPLALLELPPEARQKIFTSTKNFNAGTISPAQFQSDMKGICTEHKMSFENMRLDTANKLRYIYNANDKSEISINKQKIFMTATTSEWGQFRVLLETVIRCSDEILPLIDEYAEEKGYTTFREYLKYAEGILIIIKALIQVYDGEYQNALATSMALKNLDFGKFDKDKFDEEYGIVGSKNEYFTEKAINSVYEEGFEKLDQQLAEIENKPDLRSSKFEPNVLNNESSSYHFIRHSYLEKKYLTSQEYFKMIEDWFGNVTNQQNAVIFEEESCALITYLSPIDGVRSIKIDRSEDYAIITVLYEKPEDEDFLRKSSKTKIFQ